MFFAYDITITAATTRAAPKKQTLKLSKGVIVGCYIKYPAGCHGMVEVRLFRYESQLVPLSRDEWVTGDDETVPTETWYRITETPTQLKFHGASPGTTYNHTVTVRIMILPLFIAAPYYVLRNLVKILSRVFRIPVERPPREEKERV